MDIFRDFRGLEHLHDARVLTEDGWEFPVHRIPLAMRSEYFRNTFCSLPEQTDFLIRNIKGSTMEIILEYIYTGELNFNESQAVDVLLAADLFSMENLLNITRFLVIGNITMTNCVSLLDLGTKNMNLGVLKASSRFIEVNFELIIRDENSRFDDLTADSLENLLFSKTLYVSSEREIFKSIMLWISKLPDDRNKYFKKFLKCIQLHDGSNNLALEVFNHPLEKENTSYIDLVEFILNKQIIRPRIPKRLYFITKRNKGLSGFAKGIEIFITYDENIDVWRKITTNTFRPDVVLQVFRSLVVMFEKSNNFVSTFDFLTKTWTSLNPPNIPRWDYRVVKLKNHIYVLGGWSLEDGENVTAVERYDFEMGNWEFVASYDDIRFVQASTFRNEIYIIGLSNEPDLLAARVYNADTDMWFTIKAPNVYRYCFDLVVYKEQLFIVGGEGEEELSLSVEVYDASKDCWRDFENLPSHYCHSTTVVINDILYVYDSFGTNPVFWDETSGKWQVVETSSPFYDLILYKFCTIEDSEVITEIIQGNIYPDSRCFQSPFFVHLNS